MCLYHFLHKTFLRNVNRTMISVLPTNRPYGTKYREPRLFHSTFFILSSSFSTHETFLRNVNTSSDRCATHETSLWDEIQVPKADSISFDGYYFYILDSIFNILHFSTPETFLRNIIQTLICELPMKRPYRTK